jgi:hypothetical protein
MLLIDKDVFLTQADCSYYTHHPITRDGKLLETGVSNDWWDDTMNWPPESRQGVEGMFLELKRRIEEETTYDFDQDEADYLARFLRCYRKFSVEYGVFLKKL